MALRIRCLDLETTGLESSDHVVEIAAVDVLIEPSGTVHVEVVGSDLVRPPGSIPPEASAIHHLTDADVAMAASWAGVAPAYPSPYVAAYAAHNASYERKWLTPEKGFGAPWIDTYRCAQHLWPDAPGHSNQVLRYWRKPALLAEHLVLVPHRALGDALVTACLLADMLMTQRSHEQSASTVQDLLTLSETPVLLRVMPFGKHKGVAFQEIPIDYLNWVAKQSDMGEDVLHTAKHHLTEHYRRQRRGDGP